jgi:ATP-binding cassette subfamily F protein uup
MDNVITSLIVLDGRGGVDEYVGGYSDWEARGGSLSDAKAGAAAKSTQSATAVAVTQRKQDGPKPAKLSYKDQRELGNLPARIEKLEIQQAQLEKQISEPGFYQSDRDSIRKVMQELEDLQVQLEAAFARWSELEAARSPID